MKLSQLTPILIFGICSTVYWRNGQYLAIPDTWSNSLLAFNLLENHTFHFDFLRSTPMLQGMRPAHFFTESDTGHLATIYPIGTAVLTFPLYIIFFVILKVQASLQGISHLDLAADGFYMTRLFYEKVAANIVSALSVVMFYRLLRLKFSGAIALLTTFIFAFATSMWSTSSQALWQHGPVALLVTSAIWCLLKANRSNQRHRHRYLILAGIACGLLPGVRPTAGLFSMVIVAYTIGIYRWQAMWLLPGFSLHLPSLAWNLYFFHHAQGAYASLDSIFADMANLKVYSIAPQRLIKGGLGLLFSPSRGLISFSPILLYALGGIKPLWQERHQKDAPLFMGMIMASLLLFASYSAYFMWWGGDCYGPRFLVDILPIVGILLAYGLNAQGLVKLRPTTWKGGLFALVLVYSITIQVIGAGGALGILWDGIPGAVETRLWDWQDSRVTRGVVGLWQNWQGPPPPSALLPVGLGGRITSILGADSPGLPITAPITGRSIGPLALKLAGVNLKAEVENTGTTTWYGYPVIPAISDVQVRGLLYNEYNQMVQESRLYIRNNTPPGAKATAIGLVPFPDVSGRYRLKFELIGNSTKILHQFKAAPLIVQSEGWRKYGQAIQLTDDQNSPQTSIPNRELKIPIKLTNKSNFLWRSQGAYPINLSYRWVRRSDQSIQPEAAIRTALATPIPVGHRANLVAIVKTPTQPGEYNLVLSMVEEGNAWLDNLGSPGLSLPYTIEGAKAL